MTHKLTFITDNINELLIKDRREILQIIYNSPARSKLKEKGGGTQIKLNDLSDQQVENIYVYVMEKLTDQQIL
jgi:intracellular sulfur oxidation DsrE/DsrF family protein